MLLLLPQRYKFSSKSQQLLIKYLSLQVVVATAKVQIFKQITTGRRYSKTVLRLLLLPQRYKFSSKSQHITWLIKILEVVVATAKVQIFKQITTIMYEEKIHRSCCCYRKGTNFQANHNGYLYRNVVLKLLLLPQRYKFSSKSQRHFASSVYCRVVVATAKVQIFKQITTARLEQTKI